MRSNLTTIFSTPELELMQATGFLEMKRSVTKKMYILFNEVRDSIKTSEFLDRLQLPYPLDRETGKITRGEAYRQRPWVLLDFPRYFKRPDIFACRTMFWWGHPFICTFHLAGRELQRFAHALADHLPQFTALNTWIATGADPWNHIPEKPDFRLASEWKPGQVLQQAENGFLKICRTLSLEDYRNLPQFARESYDLCFECLG